MNIGECVVNVNGVMPGVLVGILGNEGFVKCEHGTTYIFPRSALRKSNHTTRYSKAEIDKAIAHHATRKLDLCASLA